MSAETKTQQIEALRQDGFVIVRGLVPPATCAAMRERAQVQLAEGKAPHELEAQLQYPGAPASIDAPGGKTVRRLLDAYGREPAFADFATSPDIAGWVTGYFGEQTLLSRAHHNCLMTKHPQYGSLTGWHRDARYWSFSRDDLVSVWLALGDETASNGALWLIPGSHQRQFAPESFDDAKFFVPNNAENASLITRAVCPTLAAGDVLFFHCNTLHSAGKNVTDAVKFSLVFTYHGISNPPVPGTRSTSKEEVSLI
ncbi:phytanoyl-CoA dioxygenase [Robbsia andropogonis]|uniref:Phytanoyl-CoA dioxygenase n=1 Tax=Robbsia andropogonis TaxID=28092 RepID=A0A0F5K4T9_9BURK|nr:phytanoyl-CoA dioxygenase family protein [Robbsia andropogonis]KKB64542.1 phytanoyl-CoA dioxygenase [Robbsia andropogonis]MCP1119002.1 phytanoyl-CoA dioxygenase family protein [Robbsia andropogonis]MCP1128646.1 phytanoyl-CoA dioxygenase family protein [Robbsia andropogonis]